MNFGFGPGDIVAVITFGKKVIDALQEEDGSGAEYRIAAQQCQDFFSAMDEVKRLDLSHLPESFHIKLKSISSNVEEHIALFKKHTIGRYDKSLGKDTKRGWFGSAPRKVQWAFGAADDLDKFRQSVASWLTCIQLHMVGQLLGATALIPAFFRGLPAPTRSLSLPPAQPSLPSTQLRGFLEWRPEVVSTLQTSDVLDNLSNMVYERLLTRPGLPPSELGKVFTLPDTDDAEATFLGITGTSQAGVGGPSSTSNALTLAHRSNELAGEGDGTLVTQTNRYLEDLQLPVLSSHEATLLDGRITRRQELPQIESGSGPQRSDPAAEQASEAPVDPREEYPRVSRNQREVMYDIHIAKVVAELSGRVARATYHVTSLYRMAPSVFRKDLTLMERLERHCMLLEYAAGVWFHSASSEKTRQFGKLFFEKALCFMNDIEDGTTSIFGDFGLFKSFIIVIFVRGIARRRWLSRMQEKLESSKMDLSLMLQISQIELAQKAALQVHDGFRMSHQGDLLDDRA